jgi:hypothetical protein
MIDSLLFQPALWRFPDGSAEAESNEGAAESDPFAGSAEDHAAKKTRRKTRAIRMG